MKKIYTAVAFITLGLSARSAQKNESQGSIDFIAQEETTTAKADGYFNYLKAIRQHQMGNVREAYTTYQKLLTDKDLISPYEGYIHLLFDTGQHGAIVGLFEKKGATFEKMLENNLDIQLALAQSYLALNQETKANTILSALTEKYPDNEQISYYTAVSLLQKQDFKAALKFIDKCLKKEALKARHFLFLFLQSKIYLHTKDFPKALASIDESLKRSPRFDRGWLFKAILLEQQGKINEAINGYKHFLDISGNDETIEKQLVQLLFMQNRFTEAADCLKKIRSNKPEYFFDMALIELRGQQYESALKNIDEALTKNPSFKKARLLKIEILLALKDFDALGSFMHAWIEKNPLDTSIIHTLLLLPKADVPLNVLIKCLEKVVKKENASINILAALADLYLDAHDYKNALSLYKKMFKATSDESLKSKILFHMAYLYYTTNHMNQVEKLLEKAIGYQDSYPPAYNLLAYFYAQRDMKLEKALELIDHAIATDPACYYFLDTKGCVLLKLGKHNEAQALFKQALQLAPDDTIVREHLNNALEKHENS
ncbi:MAG: tetratricopeptide repeat protein [Candidatus Babeliales bacterium]